MATSNVEALKAAHQAFNRRDFDAVVRAMAPDCVYVDLARNRRFVGPSEFKGFLREWVAAMSDCAVTDAEYIDGGGYVVATFTCRGKHDGPLGSIPPTGRDVNLPICEVIEFDDNGRTIVGKAYYDQLTMLAQLGAAVSPMPSARPAQAESAPRAH